MGANGEEFKHGVDAGEEIDLSTITAEVHSAWRMRQKATGWAPHPWAATCLTACAFGASFHDDRMVAWDALPQAEQDDQRAVVRRVMMSLWNHGWLKVPRP